MSGTAPASPGAVEAPGRFHAPVADAAAAVACAHRWLIETLAREGRFHGRCPRCGEARSWPAEPGRGPGRAVAPRPVEPWPRCGHAMTPENVLLRAKVRKRCCRTCFYARQRERYAERRDHMRRLQRESYGRHRAERLQATRRRRAEHRDAINARRRELWALARPEREARRDEIGRRRRERYAARREAYARRQALR